MPTLYVTGFHMLTSVSNAKDYEIGCLKPRTEGMVAAVVMRLIDNPSKKRARPLAEHLHRRKHLHRLRHVAGQTNWSKQSVESVLY